jgi:hypothetical protein
VRGNFRTGKAKPRRAARPGKIESDSRKEINMEYLVVFATMLMIAGYACIIGNSLRGAK